MRYIGEISSQNISKDNIKWLVIEPDINKGTVGYHIFLHKNIDEPSVWDNWYPSLDTAFKLGEVYGLKKEDWIVE
jgi:hypothetical protein